MVERLRNRLGDRLSVLRDDVPLLPLFVLAGLNLVDEFDRMAFSTLSPEIRDTFGMSDTGIVAISVVAGAFIVMAAIPMGLITDRLPRVRLAAGAALLWGSMSILTGLVPTILLLFVVRLLSGLGRTANEVVHPSLLNDYYEPRVLPSVFMIHRLANPVGLLSAILAAVVASLLSWEWAFVLLAVPTFALLAGVVRLREPTRGETIDADLARAADAADRVAFGQARRELFTIRSLRRIWVSSFLIGIGAINITQFLTLYFEQVHGFETIARGLVLTVYGLGQVAGLVVGMRLADRAMQDGDEPHLARINGQSGFLFGIGLLLAVLSPVWPLAVAAVLAVGVGAGWFQPAYYSLVGRVAPPRIRGQAYAWAVLFVGVGALLGVLVGAVGDEVGWREALGILALTTLLAGAISWSAAKFVRRDITQADNALATAAAIREQISTSGTAALLTCRGVEVAYDQVQVLFGADLEVHDGEIVALLGTNGAGKSTLLNAISGLVDPIGGVMIFDGEDVTHAGAMRTAELGLLQVPGGRAIFPTLTVAEHLDLAAWLDRGTAAATREVYDLFPILHERRHQLAGDLSGGEQQMLGLGMALLHRPKLLMIDELSLGLAPRIVEQLLEVVRRIREQGTAVIVVEQSVNVALALADRAYFMEKGEVRFEGPTEELLERRDLLRSIFLEGATRDSVASGNEDGAGTEDAAEDHVPAADEDTTELTVVSGTSSGSATDKPPILAVEHLTKRFGGIVAVDDASVALQDGEVLGIIGANGAGKTTLFDLVSGYLAPDAGRVLLRGEDVTRKSPHKRARLGLGRSFQDARLVPSLTVAENIALGLERHLDWHDHIAASLALPAMVRQEEDVAWTVKDLIEMLGLGAFRDKFVRELSTGSRRIVDLAMVIGHDPDVLLLDEPSSGIAQRETEQLGPLLRRIQRETGCAMLVIEHDVPLVTAVADRLVAMELGRPIAEGDPREVIRDPLVISAYLGGDEAAIRRSGTAKT